MMLSGKRAVVTGALGYLGSAWCEALESEGARVFGIDIGALTPWSYRADVTSWQQLKTLREETLYGDIDILVTAHGLDAPPGAGIIHETAMMETNFYGMTNACRVFRPRSGGAVVNVASLYAIVSPDKRVYNHLSAPPNSEQSDIGWNKPAFYGASKAAVVAWSRQMATQWARHDIRVNCLTLGGVQRDQDVEFIRKYAERVPMSRMATVEDTIGPLLFLCSDASRYVTGINLVVDGGYSAW